MMLTTRLLLTALVATITLVSSETDVPDDIFVQTGDALADAKNEILEVGVLPPDTETPVPTRLKFRTGDGQETSFPSEIYFNTGGETPFPSKIFEVVGGDGLCGPLGLACCEEDCCGEGTSWDGESASCILDPSSSGFNGTYSSAYNEGCILRTCCEDECCSPGTEYDNSNAACIPQGTPSAGRLAYRDPESCPKPASDNNCTEVNVTVDDRVNCDGCEYSNQCKATAANSTFTPDTCLNATQLQYV